MNKIIEYDSSGKFICELPNRFMSSVNIDGVSKVCYVKSSSRLENYIKMKNRIVYLKKTFNSKFKYYIYAMKYKRSAIILCPSYANDIFYNSLNKRCLSFINSKNDVKKEYIIDDYKSDFFIPKEKMFIEIKAIISENESDVFPSVYSERFEKQLNMFLNLLEKGYSGCLFLISLNPYMKDIHVNTNFKNYDLLIKNIEKGLVIKGFAIDFINGQAVIKKEIPIVI